MMSRAPAPPMPTPFTHSEADWAIHDEVLRFTRHEIARYELADKFEPAAWKKMADVGLMGLPLPKEFGGAGASISATVLAFEAFARAGGSLSLALSWGASVILCGIPILLFGTEEQKSRYLPGLASGGKIGAFALTEPGAGSDAAGLTTRAVRTEKGYLLNGSKMFITNGPMADVLLVLASTNPAGGRDGITAFLVERDMPGFRTGKPLDKMGHRASPTCELIFEDCLLPLSARLGPENRGFVEVAFSTLEWERSCMLGPMAGLGELVLERCAAHAKSRRQFGKPIAAFGAVRQMLGEISARAMAAGLHWRRMAWLKEQGHPAVLPASMAKLVMSEDGLILADRAVQIHGGYGYIREYPVEQLYRDVKLYTLGGGTSEIQQRIILEATLRHEGVGDKPIGRASLSLRDPFVAALVGPEGLHRLQALHRHCESQFRRESVAFAGITRGELRLQFMALAREGFWSVESRAPAGPSVVRAMAIELLTAADPWIGCAAVAALGEPTPSAPLTAFAMREVLPAGRQGSPGLPNRPATATSKGPGRYLLLGRWDRILNAQWADRFVVPASLEGRAGKCIFLVDAGTPGQNIATPSSWPTPNGLPFGDLVLYAAPVEMLGEPGSGEQLIQLFLTQHWQRLGAAACGVASAALNHGFALAAATRAARNGAELQEAFFPLARLLAELETSRLLVWRAAQALDAAEPEAASIAAAAKVRATRTATRAVESALTLDGAYSPTPESGRLTALWAIAAGLAVEAGTDTELLDRLASRALGETN